MKKVIAMVLILVMMLALGVTSFAASGPLTLEQAKQAALNHVGVKAADVTFVKAHRDWDDGREYYDIEFVSGNTKYDLDVDRNTGAITGYDVDFVAGYTQPTAPVQPTAPTAPAAPQPVNPYGYYDYDDIYDYDDRYDYDDIYDRYDDMYDYDDMFDAYDWD